MAAGAFKEPDGNNCRAIWKTAEMRHRLSRTAKVFDTSRAAYSIVRFLLLIRVWVIAIIVRKG